MNKTFDFIVFTASSYAATKMCVLNLSENFAQNGNALNLAPRLTKVPLHVILHTNLTRMAIHSLLTHRYRYRICNPGQVANSA